MIGSRVLFAFIGVAGVLTAQTAGPRTEKAQRFEVRGRVVDEAGDAVEGALIGVVAVGSEGPPPVVRFPNYTDEHGDFSLSLERGKYYIRASPTGGLDNQQEIHTDGSSGDPYGRTYYPSTVNEAAATPVAVPVAPDDADPIVIRMLRHAAGPVAVSTPADQKSASVEGIVVNQVTGAPLGRVHVSLWNHDDNSHRDYGAMTNPDGTFSITGMPPVTYGIIFDHAGFSDPRPGRTTLALSAGEHVRGLKLPLVPTGAIAGRVVGPDGEPAEAINVYVRGTSGQQGSTTDEQGRFRIYGLLPGTYRLEAPPLTWNRFPRPTGPPEIPSDGKPPTRWGAANYPGTIEVKAGSETGGIQVRLTRAPVVRVSGRVTGFTQGESISLSVNGSYGGFTDSAKADGTFAWWNLDPGEYMIEAWQGVPSVDWPVGRPGTRPPSSAQATITVADANVDHIELRMRPPSDISGQVEYETGSAESAGRQRWLRLGGVDRINRGGAATLTADGHFTLNPLIPGRYRVMCDCGHPAYVKSMWLGAAQIDGDILDLREGPAGATLRVLVSSAFGAISGSVQGARDAMAGLKVALIASPGHNGPSRFADVDAGGRYSFDSVVPGEYQLVVVDYSDLPIRGIDGLEQYRAVMAPVKIVAGESIVRNPGTLKRP